MANRNTNPNDEDVNESSSRERSEASQKLDLQDSAHDAARLEAEETVLDLPDVKDIPGQEFVQVPPLGMLADTTISSADEEGVGLFDDEEDDVAFARGTEGDVSRTERQALERGEEYMPTRDERALEDASLDNTDFEGELLNETGFGDDRTGADLDLGDVSDDTTKDALGQGDEENKHYSLGSEDNDANETRSS